MLTERFDLPLDFVLGQESLVTLPYKPFRVNILHHRVHTAPYIVHTAEIREVGTFHARNGAFSYR